MSHLPLIVAGAALLISCSGGAASTGRTGNGPAGHPGRAVTAAEEVIDRQVAAYNRHDAQGFADTYAAHAAGYEYPDRLLFAGRDSIRAQYARFFAATPALRVRVTQRIVRGAYVVDHEHITGIPGADTVRAIAIYEVRDGFITSVRYIP